MQTWKFRFVSRDKNWGEYLLIGAPLFLGWALQLQGEVFGAMISGMVIGHWVTSMFEQPIVTVAEHGKHPVAGRAEEKERQRPAV